MVEPPEQKWKWIHTFLFLLTSTVTTIENLSKTCHQHISREYVLPAAQSPLLWKPFSSLSLSLCFDFSFGDNYFTMSWILWTQTNEENFFFSEFWTNWSVHFLLLTVDSGFSLGSQRESTFSFGCPGLTDALSWGSNTLYDGADSDLKLHVVLPPIKHGQFRPSCVCNCHHLCENGVSFNYLYLSREIENQAMSTT